MLPLVVTAAIVVEDQVFLRTAPEERAPHPVLLYKGDWVEVRGETRGYLQVYDYRHERPGYVAPSRVRKYPVDASSAEKLRAIIEFVRDTSGMESLGIAHVALYLRTAPAETIDASIFDALGTMAERLARRTSMPEHLEVARSYGLEFRSVETEDRVRTCYDGDAFRRVLQLGGTIEERGRAVLALTDARCPPAAAANATWTLDQVDAVRLEPAIANRIRLRRVGAWARLAHELARSGDAAKAKEAAERAIDELARADKSAFEEEDKVKYEEAAVLAATVRFAIEPPPPAHELLRIAKKDTGQTCLLIADQLERCTYGVLWANSARVSPRADRVLALASPIPGWVELWVFARANGAWTAETIIPAATEPELGYVEPAGWLPDGNRFLAVREAKVEGAIAREFLVVGADNGVTQRRARTMRGLGEFKRHATAEWRQGTLALR